MKFIIIFFLLSVRFAQIICSVGDRSNVYQKCLRSYILDNCLEGGISFMDSAHIQQDTWSSLLQWSCQDECRYDCMWYTVTKFEDKGHSQPKFYGKWPFIKIMGVQEPAAVFSSLLNLAANVYMYRQLNREFPVNSSVLAAFWHGFASVCMNAWVWSSVFHTRDTPLTEFMDYAGALSMVMALFVAAVVRVFYRHRHVIVLVLTLPLFYFVMHVQYLYTGRVDYDYNMKVNVFFGVTGSLLWLVWSGQQYLSGRRHARFMLLFTALNGAALSLELLDFPPLWRAWDAHALWHLATAPLPLLFYRFIIDDLRLLQLGQRIQYEKLDIKQT